MSDGSNDDRARADAAFPPLSEEQFRALAARGTTRATRAGDELYKAGETPREFIAVSTGSVSLVDCAGGERRVVGQLGPRQFAGEAATLTGQAALLSAAVDEPGEVLRVPVQELRRVVADDASLGDLLFRAFLARRSMLIGLGAGLRIIGSRYSPDTRRLQRFAARNRLPHRWIDVEEDTEAETLLEQLGIAPDETPVVILGDHRVMRNPSNRELAAILGFEEPADDARWDIIVVGAGPAGLAAGVYGASEGFATIVLDSVATGGQAGTSSRIENYLGFPAGISGGDLADRAVVQAEKFGARFALPGEATKLAPRDGGYAVHLDDGATLHGRTVVIATGARYRKLPVARLDEFEDTSVFYAATAMEAHVCRRMPVAVVGGGNSAGQAALFLSTHASRVPLLIRHDDIARDMSRYLVDRIARSPDVEVLRHTEIRALVGDRELEAVDVDDNRTGETRRLPTRRVFVFIGAEPHTQWLGDEIALDDHGFVLTGASARERASSRAGAGGAPPLATSLPGVFAAGDVRSGSIKRVASAVGEGAMAVRLAYEHLRSHESGPAHA
ncbi:MAG: FAD-dependent oxidoreductase [Actinobacteria bacterium]|nr:FAD-dependent oxidoreductase [Actinomycetota bacterium]